jgi:hypothetical protein
MGLLIFSYCKFKTFAKNLKNPPNFQYQKEKRKKKGPDISSRW